MTHAGGGTSCCVRELTEEVFMNQDQEPYVLETDGSLNLAALQLQPATIVINRSVNMSGRGAVRAFPTETEL